MIHWYAREYIRYWQQECDKLEAAIRGLGPAYAVELAADLKRYKSIASSVGEFLSIVADRINPDIQEPLEPMLVKHFRIIQHKVIKQVPQEI